MLFLWSINGELLAVVDSIDISSLDQFPNVILSVAFSTVNKFICFALFLNPNLHGSFDAL